MISQAARAVVVAGGQRHGNRRQAEETPFHGRGDGAGIDHVVAHVGEVVDAGDDDVRLLRHQAGQRQMHAVGRRAGHAPGVFVEPLGAQRLVEGQRVACAGTVAIRRHHGDRVAGRAQVVGKHADARCIHAIIVADQYSHGNPCGEERNRRSGATHHFAMLRR
jgi:hypothetical protein